jgi:putative phosphoribosyl transferase
MIFKDREDAGKKLSVELLKDKDLLKNQRDIVVVSLLRGGVVVGQVVAEKLQVQNIFLAATKIESPLNPELAIGAVCLNKIYLEKNAMKHLGLEKETIDLQISLAKFKHNRYVRTYNLRKIKYEKLHNKTIIVVDDGIATGATVKAAYLFIKSMNPRKIILAAPVSPKDFDDRNFDRVIILHKDSSFSSVSQFYERFPQVETI